jgi:hypothetical protein
LNPNRLERLPLDSCFERFNIDREIGKFRQRDRSPALQHRSRLSGYWPFALRA